MYKCDLLIEALYICIISVCAKISNIQLFTNIRMEIYISNIDTINLA